MCVKSEQESDIKQTKRNNNVTKIYNPSRLCSQSKANIANILSLIIVSIKSRSSKG